MAEDRTWDNLNILTKGEIVEYLKQRFYISAPSKMEIGNLKKRIEREQLQKELDDHEMKNNTNELAKEIYELAKKFNNSQDVEERFRLFKKRVGLIKDVADWYKKHQDIASKIEETYLWEE